MKVLSSLISKVVGQDIIGRFKKDGGVGWIALHVTATERKGAVREDMTTCESGTSVVSRQLQSSARIEPWYCLK